MTKDCIFQNFYSFMKDGRTDSIVKNEDLSISEKLVLTFIELCKWMFIVNDENIRLGVMFNECRMSREHHKGLNRKKAEGRRMIVKEEKDVTR